MSIMDDALFPAPPAPADEAAVGFRAELCVLASGSSGNCSVLLFRRGGVRRACLIDLGLSPRRTFRLLDSLGLSPHHIDDAIVTHLDHDHFHPGWTRALPRHTTLHVHERHADGDAFGLFGIPAAVFNGGFTLRDGTVVRSVLADHDDHGVATLRFCLPCEGRADGAADLGFATDVGRVTDALVEHLAGVDVLAIESNYCPELQEASGRPQHLKSRIMGGRGHLSNHEAVQAIGLIEPRSHVVLLHLSRECNDPELVAGLHEGADYAVTITDQYTPTRWIRIGA
jgi:ribonuclease BN (tRNA processing enzyme)